MAAVSMFYSPRPGDKFTLIAPTFACRRDFKSNLDPGHLGARWPLDLVIHATSIDQVSHQSLRLVCVSEVLAGLVKHFRDSWLCPTVDLCLIAHSDDT